jgi:hypothetical protein
MCAAGDAAAKLSRWKKNQVGEESDEGQEADGNVGADDPYENGDG